jgi:multidrug efflux pump subunit AcrB
MKDLIRFFLNNHKLTIILSLMMVVFGLMGMMKLNAESYPSVNFAMATVTTRYDGATAKDIETQITKQIEDKIREVSGLKDVRSISKSGLSSIFVRVDMDNEDEDAVLEELQKAVDSVSNLPSDLRDDPVYNEVNSEEFPAVEIAIVGANTGRARDLMVDLLKEDLEDNKRILNVRPVGFLKRQFNIRLDDTKMNSLHIGLEEVTNKIRRRNVDVPGGNIKSEGSKTLIRVEGKVRSIPELENVVIRSNFSGQKILLKDIAQVDDGEEDEKILTSFNGKPATFLILNKKAGADTISLVHDVDTILEKYNKLYKDKFEIVIYNNEADKVKDKLNILSSNAISGLLLVVVFLFLFLPGKVGLMASLSLPLAVMATIGFMPIFGMNLDAITILALVIALGMMVDNAVVISENFARLRDEEGLSSLDAAAKSVDQLWLPITATAFTTIAAFLPMLVTKGIMGQFIMWIPIVVTISLIVSLSEGFFLLPMRLRFVSSKVVDPKEVKKDWFHVFIEKFENMMRWCVANRYKMLFMFGGILFGSLLLMTKGNKFMLFPPEQTEIYLGRVEMPRGTTVTETRKELDRITVELRKELGDNAKWITARAGISNMGPTDPKGATGENHGLIIIYASDYAKYNVMYTDFLDIMKKVKSDKVSKLKYEEMVNGPPVGAPISATFRSNNEKNLSLMINEVIAELSKVEGIYDLETDDILGEKEAKVLIDYDKTDQLGLSVQSVGNAIRTALSGTMVSKIILNDKEVDLNVRYSDTQRKNLTNLDNIKVMDLQGNLVPVKTVAKTHMTEGSYEIKRFDFKRSKTLTGKVDGTNVTSITANAELTRIYNSLHAKYQDVNMVFGGEGENTKESMESLGQALMLALMGIFGLMVFLFKSYLRPIIIMSTIPLGLVGFSVAFFFHNKPISFLAMIGVIGLAGIIVNSGIVLISFIDQLREEGKMSLDKILVKASGMRLRAVLVTSLTTVSGLLPTAYGIGGSDSMLVPMTMAMAWGLTSGTILTLIWVPCAYAILEDFIKFQKNIPFLKFFVQGHVDDSKIEEGA